MKDKNEIIIYQPDETIRLEVLLSNQTVWLSQAQMCHLFKRDVSVISRHIRNIFSEGELEKESNLQNLQIANSSKPITLYSLDVIISVGYRIKSIVGTRFRQWANKILKTYLLGGFIVNDRLEKLEYKVNRHEEKLNLILKTSIPQAQGIFYEGQLFDANILITKYIKSAKKSILLIDNWIDSSTLEILSKKKKEVSLKILTSKKGNLLSKVDIMGFTKQYGCFSIVETNSFHDRFLIIDDKSLYHIGASLKDLGKKCFAVSKMEAKFIKELIRFTKTE